MWSKIFLGLFAVSVFVVSFFSFYAWSWLQSIGDPRAASAGYEYHMGIAWPLLWISAVLLLLLGNAVLWTVRRSWAMWVTFVFLALFIVIRFFWLDRSHTAFLDANNLTSPSLNFGPVFAAVMIVVLAAVVFFNQFLVVRLHERMYPPTVPEEPPAQEEA